MKKRTYGFSLIELLVVLAMIALLLGILLPALSKVQGQAKLLKDGSQIRSIHQAWLISSRENKGSYPVPGLIQRREIINGANSQVVPGRGSENILHNVHQNLYSACIMLNYFSLELCVGPTEPSTYVYVKHDYNWDLYNPIDNVRWDDSFKASLHRESHLSYAQLPLFGERRAREWRESGNSKFAIVGNRAVRFGTLDETRYNESVTLKIHGGARQWIGNVAFNDNHIETFNTFTPEGLFYQSQGVSHADNLYRNDSGSIQGSFNGHDILLTVTTRVLGEACNAGWVYFTDWD